jgi:hypothetical protein
MLTKPMCDGECTMPPAGSGPAPGFGTLSVLMPPGRYTVRLTVDGKTQEQPLEVLKDPNQKETDQDIRASTDLLLAIQNDMNNASEMLGTIETVRSQIEALAPQLANVAEVRATADDVAKKFLGVEGNLVDPRLTGRGQDEVRYPVKLGGQLNWLAGGVSASDYAPTTQQGQVQQVLDKQARDTRDALQRLIAGDLARLNAQLKAKGLKTIEVSMPAVVF